MSYEHVPPQAAFNNRKVVLATADEYWNRGQAQGLKVRGDYLQRGHGVYTLCERCNNTTGDWYGRQFVEWSRRGMELFDKTGGRGDVIHFGRIRPLPVIKQITTMFLAMEGYGGFRIANINLVRFVLNQEARYLDPRYRFWMYFVGPGCLRRTPLCSVINTNTGQTTTGIEFSFPPFGYMLTLDSVPEDKRLFEITPFARYRYGEMDYIQLSLAVLPTHGPMLGDYRSFKKFEGRPNENVILTMR
jgi:hypothetical protein